MLSIFQGLTGVFYFFLSLLRYPDIVLYNVLLRGILLFCFICCNLSLCNPRTIFLFYLHSFHSALKNLLCVKNLLYGNFSKTTCWVHESGEYNWKRSYRSLGSIFYIDNKWSVLGVYNFSFVLYAKWPHFIWSGFENTLSWLH